MKETLSFLGVEKGPVVTEQLLWSGIVSRFCVSHLIGCSQSLRGKCDCSFRAEETEVPPGCHRAYSTQVSVKMTMSPTFWRLRGWAVGAKF